MNRIKKQGSLPGERCGVSLSVRFFARSVSALIFPEKPSLEAGLDEEIAYTKELLSVLEEGIAACGDKKIQDLAERIRGLLDTDKIREIRSKDDEDARFGHKTPSSTLGNNVYILDGEKRITFGKGGNTTFANSTLTIKTVDGLYKQIKTINPDVVIVEGFGSWSPYGIRYAFLHRKKLMMFYERTKYVERNSPWYRTLYRILIGHFVDHFFINGIQTEEYLIDTLYFKSTPKTLGVMRADSFNLQKNVRNTSINDINKEKDKLNISRDGLTFLFVGQIVERKGIRQLLAAWRKHTMEFPNDHLIVIGTGILEDKMLEDYKDIATIHILGSISYDKLHLYYALTDVFIMPTLEDNWCLVLPEAMACKLPVACSIYNGGTSELIKDGVNGYAFDPLNETSILEILSNFHHVNLIEMGEKSIQIESNFTPDKAAKRILEACKSVLK